MLEKVQPWWTSRGVCASKQDVGKMLEAVNNAMPEPSSFRRPAQRAAVTEWDTTPALLTRMPTPRSAPSSSSGSSWLEGLLVGGVAIAAGFLVEAVSGAGSSNYSSSQHAYSSDVVLNNTLRVESDLLDVMAGSNRRSSGGGAGGGAGASSSFWKHNTLRA